MKPTFEQFLIAQSQRLTRSEPEKIIDALIELMSEALQWFDLDRFTLFPNSMILLNDGKTVSVSRSGIPDLDMQRFLKGNYTKYLEILRAKNAVQLYEAKTMAVHPVDPIQELYKEGVRWHGIIKLSLFGQTWGALAFSSFSEQPIKMDEQQLQRLKLVCDVWLCFWQHANVTCNLSQGKSNATSEADKLLLLTPKQCTILSLLATGLTAKQVAEKLFLSPRTIESHKYRMLNLLEFDNHTELVQFALRNGLTINA